MGNKWGFFKEMHGWRITMMITEQLNVYHYYKEIKIHSDYPVLEFEHQVSLENRYWRLDWLEDEMGSDFLIIHEQERPEPHPHEWDDELKKVTAYKSSSYSVLPNVVKHLTGYVLNGEDEKFLIALLFELEEVFILIEPEPVIEIKITQKKPDVFGIPIFST